MYELVTQEDDWGCGAACVASLLGVDYAEGKRLVEGIKRKSVNAQPHGLELWHIALALSGRGVRVVADWDPPSIPNGTIVCVWGPGRYKGCHYILKTPHGWMDPWYNLRKHKQACYRKEYPRGSSFFSALVPLPANSSSKRTREKPRAA